MPCHVRGSKHAKFDGDDFNISEQSLARDSQANRQTDFGLVYLKLVQVVSDFEHKKKGKQPGISIPLSSFQDYHPNDRNP